MVPCHVLGTTCLLLLALAGTARAQQSTGSQPLITPVASRYELLLTGEATTVRVPLLIRAGVRRDELKVELHDVSFEDRRELSLRDALTPPPRFEDPKEGIGSAILLGIQLKSLQKAGTYHVTLRIWRPRTAGDVEEERHTLQLVRPEARLRASTEKLMVNSSYLLPCGLGSWAWGHEPTHLTLSETSESSGLTQLLIHAVTATAASERAVEGRLRFTSPESLDAGRSVTVEYAVEGCFPLGRTSGNIEVRAPQLKAPLVIPYEVKSRLVSGHILLFLALGIWAGYWLRTRSERRIKLLRRRLEFLFVDERITEVGKSSDAELLAQLANLRQRFQQAFPRADEEALQQLTTQMTEELTAYQKAFRARYEALERQLNDWSTLLTSNLLLPAPVRAAVEKRRPALEKVLETFQAFTEGRHGDLEPVSKDHRQYEPLLRQELQQATNTWVEALRSGLYELGHHRLRLLLPEERKTLQAQLQVLEGRLKAVDQDTRDTSLAERVQRLAEAREEAASLLKLVLAALKLIPSECILLFQKLPATADRNHAIEAVRREDEALSTLSASAEAREPEELLRELLDLATELPRKLRDAIFQATKPHKEDPQSFELLLDQRGLIFAIERYRHKRGLLPKEEAKANKAASAHTEEPRTFSGWQGAPGAPVASPHTPLLAVAHENLPPEEHSREALNARLRRERRKRTFVSGTLIAGISFFLFQETFVGLPRDCLAIFLWGLGLDVGVEGVNQLLRAGKLPTS